MTKEEILSKHPEAAQALIEDGKVEGLKAGKAEGAAAELARIQGIESLSVPGHEKLISQLKFDGETSKEAAAIKVLAAVQREGSNVLTAILGDSIEAADEQNNDALDQEVSQKAKDKDVLISEYKTEHGCDLKTATLAVAKANPELFKRS